MSVLTLTLYDCVIEHRPGTKHRNADALSRLTCKRSDCPDCTDSKQINNIQLNTLTERNGSSNTNHAPSNWVDTWSHDDHRDFQNQDVAIGPIKLLMENHSEHRPPKSEIENLTKDSKTLWSQWELLEIRDELMYRKSPVRNSIELQLVASSSMKVEIFKQLHSIPIGGHFGRDRTIDSIKRRFYWPGMRNDIVRWCNSCELCARSKPGPGLGRNELQQFKITEPLQCIAIDIFGPLPVRNNSNQYIMVIGDYFTKWKEAFAIENHTALTVADRLVNEFICKY